MVTKGSGARKRQKALAPLVSGILPVDNNPVERAGHRGANIQSRMETARVGGLEPDAWLKDTLEGLPVWPNSRIGRWPGWRTLPIAHGRAGGHPGGSCCPPCSRIFIGDRPVGRSGRWPGCGMFPAGATRTGGHLGRIRLQALDAADGLAINTQQAGDLPLAGPTRQQREDART